MTHLEDIKQTYSQHLFGALFYSCQSFAAGCIFILHGFFPDYCVNTGSTIIQSLNSNLQEKKTNTT